MAKGYIVRMGYPSRGKDGRDALPHQLADGDAAALLQYPLYEKGYGPLADIIYNDPYPDPRGPEQPLPVDESRLGPGNLLLITGRPFMNDAELDERKRGRRSHTTVEEKVFAWLRAYFTHCSRSEVKLSDLAAGISPRIGERRFIDFHQHGGAFYEGYGPTPEDVSAVGADGRTAAFVVHTEAVWPGGPAGLAVFGFCGPVTLGWSHLLAGRFRHLLCTTPFVMAEIKIPTPTERPQNLSFVDTWTVDILNNAN